jgi:hypothetical protein
MSDYIKLRPTQVHVLGQVFAVHYYEGLHDDDGVPVLGLCDYNARSIFINPDQTAVCEVDTLIHEMLHAAYPVSRLGEGPRDEESVVTRTATLMTHLLFNNQHLFEYIEAAQADRWIPKETV